MKQITSITDDPKQTMTITLNDGSLLILTMQYIQANKGWFLSLIYGSLLTINMRRVVSSPNLLRAFRNIVPFGIACKVSDTLEPIYKTDFLNGRAKLLILDSDGVGYVEDTVIPAYRG
jgi:hypothetical protein